MHLLDDFVTTKYNIFLLEIKKQKKKTSQASVIAAAGTMTNY